MASSPAGTGFVSLSQYLNANKGAADATATGLNNDAVAAGNAAEAADQKVGAEAQGAYAAAAKGDSYANTVAMQAQKANNPTTVDPTGLADYSSALGKTDAAKTQIAGLTNQGGVSDQLAQKYGKAGGYTQGDSSFDAGLIGGDSAAQAQFKATQNAFSGLGDYLQGQTANHYVAPVVTPDNGPDLGNPSGPGPAKMDPTDKRDRYPGEGPVLRNPYGDN